MKTSDTIKELAAALAKAQGEFKDAKKDRQNDMLGNRYSTYASVIEAVRAPLAANGLAFVQPAELAGDKVVVTTRLFHTSGEWIESELHLPIVQVGRLSALQMMGSSMTYARRYALIAMLGVATDDDNDGNEGPKEQRPPSPQRPPDRTGTQQPRAPARPASAAPAPQAPARGGAAADPPARIKAGVARLEELAKQLGGDWPTKLAKDLDQIGVILAEPENAPPAQQAAAFNRLVELVNSYQAALPPKAAA